MTLKEIAFFDNRPRRVLRCPRCHGCGKVAEPYALAPSDKPIPGSPRNAIAAIVVGSSDIFKACREAHELAVSSGQPVAFDFNNQLVVVTAADEPDKAARAWWQDVYNETPEESYARR